MPDEPDEPDELASSDGPRSAGDPEQTSLLDAFAVGGAPNWVIPVALAAVVIALIVVFAAGGEDEGDLSRDEIIARLVASEADDFVEGEATCLYDLVGADALLYLEKEAPADDALRQQLLDAATACGAGG